MQQQLRRHSRALPTDCCATAHLSVVASYVLAMASRTFARHTTIASMARTARAGGAVPHARRVAVSGPDRQFVCRRWCLLRVFDAVRSRLRCAFSTCTCRSACPLADWVARKQCHKSMRHNEIDAKSVTECIRPSRCCRRQACSLPWRLTVTAQAAFATMPIGNVSMLQIF
jgi:hypothetical protein